LSAWRRVNGKGWENRADMGASCCSYQEFWEEIGPG
jgi:hypothetical protein